MSKPDLDTLMDFAVRTSVAAGEVTLERFEGVVVEFKDDGSEVTEADRAAEERIHRAIEETYPDHGIFGEEGAKKPARSRYRWIIDPIDGTRSFASGVPLYGVLLALELDDRPILGCAHFPVLDDTVVAATGAGCWRGGKRVEVSRCDDPAEARIVTSGLEYWRDWATPAGRKGFQNLVDSGRFARTWGDCFGYVLVATGRAEVLADPACGAHWDFAPILPIVEEAGGRFTTLRGNPVRAWSTALASNGRLHPHATQCWGSPGSDADLQTEAVSRRSDS
ncbi:MAG: histidinol phosphate phosphatase [Gemmatimonas sp.]|nr:histidinol phosphate phosphatase [Gemmatimonas sp.]